MTDDILALLPSSQDDFYGTIGMTERMAAESVADHARAYLAGHGVPCRDYHGTTYSAGDAARRAVAEGCNHFLSLHFDAGTTATGGLGLYDYAAAVPFTRAILDNYCRLIGQPNRGISHRGRPDGQHPWPSVLTVPSDAGFKATATLIELGTMTQEDDISEIKDPAWRKRCGEAIAQAYMAWLGTEGSTDEEEDIMIYTGIPAVMEDGLYVLEFPDLFTALADEKYRCFLAVKAGKEEAYQVHVYGIPRFPAGIDFTLTKHERKSISAHDLWGGKAPAGGLGLTVKSDKPVSATVTILRG